ncbi:NAC transcription factor 29-like isoform X2 [Gastrolobium bilobum]|nr:NAC transcription factor 29-like isoform X2 [Gastrolobium bilobum]
MIPRGYKFCPDDVELIKYYLKPKIDGHIIYPGRIHDVDVYMHSPQELNDTYKYEGEQHTYFFTPRNRKYPNGKRPDRATGQFGFWKATGKGIPIICNDIVIGNKRSLVFYQKKPTDGVKEAVKTNWIMQEFTVEKEKNLASSSTTPPCTMQLDDWVLCKIYKTKHETEKRDREEVTISTNVAKKCKSSQLFEGQYMQTHLSTNVVDTPQFEFNQDALHTQPHLSTNLIASPQCQPNQYFDIDQYMQNLISSSSPTLESIIHENSSIPSRFSLPMQSSEFNDSYLQMEFNDIHVAATNVVDTPEFQPDQYSEAQNMQRPFSPSAPSSDLIIPPHAPVPVQSSDEEYIDPYELIINFDNIDEALDFE